jgi:hypothetical protein
VYLPLYNLCQSVASTLNALQTITIMPVTTGQIAQALQRYWEPAQTTERIKGWTRLGLLFPIRGSGGGSGRHYRYDESTLVDVVVLSLLTDGGTDIDRSKHKGLLYGLMRTRDAFKRWEANRRSGEFYLEIASRRGNPAAVTEVFEGRPDRQMMSGALISTFVDLGLAFHRVPSNLLTQA